ncbi:MAG: ABC transporter ATP-binding protein [Gammaproteobacteria bacterium]
MDNSDRLPLIKRFLCRLQKYRAALGGMLLCMVFSAALEPLLPLMLKPLLDGGESFLVAREYIPFFAGVVLVLLPAVTYGRGYLGGWLDITMQRDLRREMAAHLARRPLGAEEESGKTAARFMTFTPAMTGGTMPVLLALVQEPLKALFYLAQMFYLEWQLTLIICAALPPTAAAIRWLGRRMKKAAARAQEETGRAQSRLQESILLAPIVKVHGDTQGGRAAAAFSVLRGALLRTRIIIAAGQPLAMLAVALPSMLALFYTARALEAGTMTAGDVAAFLGCMLLMPRSIRAAARSLILLEEVLAAAREVFGFLDSPKEDDCGTKVIAKTRGDIVFKNIKMQYPGRDAPALDNFSAQIRAGETVALAGRSGAGKSTLANLIPRFYAPQQGAVLLDGEDIRNFTLASLRAQIALVTQDTLLFGDSIAANVCYPETPNAGNRAKILRALENAAAGDFVAALPQGEDSPAGENGKLLSGGQRQRISLARAFYRDTPLVILDEATSALDAETEAKIRGALQKLLAGRTAIIIAHRFAAVDFAARILVLDEGKLVAEGDSQTLLQTCPLYAGLFRAQIPAHAETAAANKTDV